MTMIYPKRCTRCHADLSQIAHTMSRFNTDIICLDCVAKERAHPDYQRAADAESDAVRRGNYNFPGIGRPHDL